MLGHRELTLDDYLAILRRRLWVILIPALLGPVVAFLASLAIPNQYTSQTLVLVEQQKVPESYVRSVVTDQLNSRLSTMKEQILSRTRLEPIIEKFGLYKEDVGKVPMEVLIGRLRGSIEVSPVLGRGRGTDVPGFYISMVASDPRTAQQVCAEITSMFMTENLQLREQRAESTTDFLTKQLEEAKRKLDDQDQRLAVFKQRYVGQLPGQEQINLNVLMGLTTQLEAVTQSLNRAQQDKAYMESVLAQQVTEWEASQVGGVNPDTLEQQLKNLQNNLVTLEARYTGDHPDVIKTKNDIAQLQKQINKIKSEAREKPAGEDAEATVALSEPPRIMQLRNQIRIGEQTIAEKIHQQERLQEQIKTYQARVQLSPVVEQQFKELTRDYETALNFYNDLLAKRTNSQMATDLERRQQGEQFLVMDPANLPQRPTFPNRPLFALGGLAAGIGLGLGIALLLEVRDKSLRSDKDVEFFLGLPTLALLPSIEAADGGKNGKWKPAARGKGPAPARIGA